MQSFGLKWAELLPYGQPPYHISSVAEARLSQDASRLREDLFCQWFR